MLITRLWAFGYPGHLWICSPSIPPFYIDWRWSSWRPLNWKSWIEVQVAQKVQMWQDDAREWRVTTTRPLYAWPPGQRWHAISERCQESAEEAEDSSKESLGRWSMGVGVFFNGTIGLFNPFSLVLAAANCRFCMFWRLLHLFHGTHWAQFATHRGIGYWAASLGGFWLTIAASWLGNKFE